MSWLSEEVWLPPGIRWEELEGEEFAQFHHLLFPFIFSILFIGIRLLIVKFIFTPAAHRLDMKPLTLNPGKNSEREKLKVAINQKRLVRFNKFCETGWRWVLYLCAHLGGLYCLYDKPWVWNTAHCWHGYPYHPIDLKIWWYYMLELSLYWCLFITQFSDLKRKDFWQMLAHHVATLFLLMFSWTNHMHRMGSFVLFIHDFSDHWLELAKLAIYAKYETACNVVFLVFTITWLYTRLSILPTVIIYSTVFEAAQIVPMFPVYYIFNFLLSILQILHIIWTYYIVKIAYKALTEGEMEDSRSDSDASSSADLASIADLQDSEQD